MQQKAKRLPWELRKHDGKLEKNTEAVLNGWLDKWENLSTYFSYRSQIRKLIYTTNTIEGFNRQLRKSNQKAKALFPNDEALKKDIIFMHIGYCKKKWSMPYRGWVKPMDEFIIEFGGVPK